MLNCFIKSVEERKCKRRGISSKVQITLDKAIRLRNNIEADVNYAKYLEQYMVEHKHSTQVKAVAFSANSKHLVSTAVDGTNVWQLNKDYATLKESLSGGESTEDGAAVLNCVSNDGRLVGVYRGNMCLTIYSGS